MLCFCWINWYSIYFSFSMVWKTDNLCLVCDLYIRIWGIYNMIIILIGKKNKRKEKEKSVEKTEKITTKWFKINKP